MVASVKTSRPTSVVTDPIRVMVVDDSVVARGLMGRWIDEDPALAVVSAHRNGRLAVEDMERSNPDVVVLDIEMPDMDGMTALPLILKKKPGVQVVMASTLTRRNAEISMRALSLGASDYVPKPESNSGVTTSVDFRRELVEKVRSLGERAVRRAKMRAGSSGAGASAPKARAGVTGTTARAGVVSAKAAAPAAGKASAGLRPFSSAAPRVLVIGSSTGGPQALAKLFTDIGGHLANVPVFITQHMPATFTAILAEHLTKSSGREAAEGKDGEVVVPGRIYVAPGGKHMVLKRQGTQVVIHLDDGPPVNFCKPAVDPMFQSAAAIYGSGTLGAVLTGMGHDGAKGALAVCEAGGSMIAQDEESSVVWGMPHAVVEENACAAILPLDQIGTKINSILNGARS